MYYDLSKALSYGAFLNFLVGERGCGKTYSLTKFVAKEFLKKGHQFVYIRRYKSELTKATPTFFQEIVKNEEFPNATFSVKGNKFIINDEVAGYSMTLSTAQNFKSTNFSKVKYIIFDEFMIEEGQGHYLRNEVEITLGTIETIGRMRDVKVFLLSNPVTITNPYFMYFGISLPHENTIRTFKDGLILVEYMQNLKYREEKKKTKFGQLISGTEYEEYAVENTFRLDDASFIEKKTGASKCNWTFKYLNNMLGVWYDYEVGKIFISKDYDPHSAVISCTTKDMSPNTMMLSIVKEHTSFKKLLKNYRLGNVYYENQKVKNLAQDIFRLCLVLK